MNKTLLILSSLLVLFLIFNVLAVTGTIDKSSINIEGETGSTYRENITLINNNEYIVRVVLSANGEIADKLSFDNEVVFLQSDEERTIFFNISSQNAGTFNGNIISRFEGNGEFVNLATSINFIVSGENIPDDENPSENIDIFVSNTEITINGNLNQIIEKTTTVRNVNDFPVNISIDNENSNIVILNNNFVLQPNEERQVRIRTTINEVGNIEKNIVINFKAEGKTTSSVNVRLKINGQMPLKADIAYLIKNMNGVDSSLLSELRRLSYTYEIITEDRIPSTDFYEYRMILVGDQDFAFPKNIPTEGHKTLILNSENYFKKSITNYQLGWSSARGSTTNPALEVIDVANPITEGIPKEFRGYSTTTSQIYILKGQKPNGVNIVVSSASLSTDAVIATLDEGKRLLNGKTLTERQVYFGLTDSLHWTSQTKSLFKNSLIWVLEGEDRDGDGFFSDVDCDDNDFDVNPDAEEIPYDEKDNDCSGGDLVDVDQDSFNSTLVGGLDCDDNNPLINPSSQNLELNCRNDPPAMENIEKITVSETENVIIVVNANDPEDDNLSYSINDLRFTNIENTFVWHTTFDDEGEYDFIVTINDGEFIINQSIQVEVINLNRAPTSLIIPEIAFAEDNSIEIDISNYFNDDDDGPLIFSINSKDENLIVEDISNGIFRLSADENWNGLSWIEFYASDGDKNTTSNRAIINVTPINDPLTFESNIDDIEFREDTNLTDAINLYYYFKDIDNDELIFEYEKDIGNEVNVIIENGLVSFIPQNDFYGEFNITFNASDGEFSSESNSINVKINPAGEYPIFDELNCETNINEDEEYQCELFGNDGDIDLEQDIMFSVGNHQNVICSIENNTLNYKSNENFNGNGYCELILRDSDGEVSRILELVISPINDLPKILSYAPTEEVISLIQGRIKEFSIRGSDIDSSLNIKWYVNGELKKQENKDNSNYVFSGNPGLYILEARISDSDEIISKTWSVVIGSFSEYTCNEVNGYVLNDDETCSGNIIGVKDTNLCCSIQGVPAFKDAGSCNTINNNIKIEINDPDLDDDIFLGESINIDLDVTNNLEEDKDLNVEAHLYNLDKDKSENSEESSIDIEKDRSRRLYFNLEIPEDLDLDDEYVLFVKAEDLECSQTYQKLNIDRPDKNVKIIKFDIPETAKCGENINSVVKIENLGDKKQDIKLKIENNKLKINEETSIFKLEEFGEDYKETKDFVLNIPEKIESGEYEIEAKAIYSDKVESVKKKIDIECNKEEVKTNIVQTQTIKTNEPIKLNHIKNNAQSNYSKKKTNFVFFAFIITLINFILIVAIINLYSSSKKKKEKRDFDIIKKGVYDMAEEYKKAESKR